MTYFITFSILITFATTLSIAFKKRIEETMPISIVSIVLIIFLAGLVNNLKIGAIIVQILTILQLIFILITILKKDKDGIKEVLRRILTPGLLIYTLLFILNVLINQGRIFEDYDEFNHWAVIIKNMFIYNTYGTNPETIVRFNEYPPFTAVFQYLFLAIQKVYREDTIIIAQNVLYLSIIIPITKKIKWNKSALRIITVTPLIVFMPMILYKNFFLNILVDGILGIMFAYTIYSAYEEDSLIFKTLKILAGTIMLCLTKTSGLGLAVLALIVILIKIIIDRKKDKTKFKTNIKSLIAICIITTIITSMWYIKVNNAEKRWDFSKYVNTEENQQNELDILKNFAISLIMRQDITTKQLTVFAVIILLIGLQIYSIRKVKNNNFSYYAIAMLISIPIYLISLAITYMTIFENMEGTMLTCFDRYTSTILLAVLCFNAFALFDVKAKFSVEIIVVASIIIALMPIDNIYTQYVRGKNYIKTSNTNRDIYTKIEKYKDILNVDDQILYMAGDKANIEYLKSMNEYVMMPVRIKNMISGNYESADKFEKAIERYDYVYIYRTNVDTIDNIKECFKDSKVQRDTLYKVENYNEKIWLEPVYLQIAD